MGQNSIRYKESTTEHGSIQYDLNRQTGTAIVSGYRGKDTEVVIPAVVEDCKVIQIGKKAFLSNKILRQITLPETIVRIDDWAFAYCARLTKIVLPYHHMEIGQGICKDCFRLEQIVDENADEKECRTTDVAWLLAAVMSRLDAFYLFDFENAGMDEWLRQWDSRMQSIMKKEDAEGFSRMLLCGEEDYGSRENNLDYYIEQRRREKVRLALLRLMHDYGLEQPVRAELEAYLLAHVKGQQTEETWKVVLEEYGDDLRYYQFLTKLGGVNEDNFQAVMEDLGESHTEMKAYLMKYHSEQRKEDDAFGAFVL